ncbi:hypothetical protein ACLB1G_18445 [Oxalobacteraceae bacterium A2-2]
MSAALHPPLALIERELFGPVENPVDATPEDGAGRDAAPAAMPPWLLALVERKVASVQAHGPQALAVGQIRCLPVLPARALGRTGAVLLGRCLGGRRWAGWLVAQEVDYAAERDLVLQDDDGILAPEAALVQTWNPVEVSLRGDEAVLGKLPAATLGAVLKLADRAGQAQEFVAPRPGRIGAWDLDGETTVVTGTPLAGPDDPRAAYQALYLRLAAECTAAAQGHEPLPPRAARSWRAWLEQVLVRPVWTFGALAVALLQAAWLLAGPFGGQEALLYRGAPAAQAEACRVKIRVMFKLDTPYAEVVLALRRVDATLVSGPSETGEIWILAAAGQDPHEVAATLRQNRLVEQTDVILPEGRSCKR